MDSDNLGGVTALMPAGTSVSDSEVDILVKYISTKVSNAPQYIELGERNWCFARLTNQQNYTYLEELQYESPLTVTCEAYTNVKLFDYKWVLEKNNLGVIIAYAFQGSKNDADYYKDISKRHKTLRALSIIVAIQIPLHLIILISGLLVYKGRGSARDLRTIPRSTLNIIAILSLIAGLTVTTITVIFVQSIKAMKNEVHNHLKSYGISVNLGILYFSFHWLVIGCSAFCMLTWVVPLWFGNPAESSRWDEPDQPKDNYVIWPYRFERTTKPKRKVNHTTSRLFDESFEIPHDDEMTTASEVLNPFEDKDPADLTEESPNFTLGSKAHSEWELRELGAKMSRKVSVRKTSRPKTAVSEQLPAKEETRNLLYGDNPFSNHQYPQALPRSETSDLTRSSTTRLLSIKETQSESRGPRTRVLLDNNLSLGPATKANGSKSFNRPESIGNASVLNDLEMEILDQNQFINRI